MTDLLSQLPLFATDRELAVAIVGKARVDMWVKMVVPQLEKHGFPPIDPLHDGRPVPLVRRFYDHYFGLTGGFAISVPDGEENPEAFKPTRNQRTATTPKMANMQHKPMAMSIAMLAERWLCSERHVRNMIARGEIPASKLGGKLLRVRIVDIEEFENRGGIDPRGTA
ncbi:helix-turn-helix domain-containing protein [Rhizobium jaguaris]|uniref:helix-turn-helix domain-containing protein n=1 Tax=Rhizobium jaguaris TaxID=1312183 RepID=UPI0039BF733E